MAFRRSRSPIFVSLQVRNELTPYSSLAYSEPDASSGDELTRILSLRPLLVDQVWTSLTGAQMPRQLLSASAQISCVSSDEELSLNPE